MAVISDPGRAPKGLVGDLFNEHAQDHADQHGDAQRCPEPQMEEGHAGVADVSADHVDVAVGEVDELDNSVNHGVAKGDEGVNTAQRQAVDHLLQ